MSRTTAHGCKGLSAQLIIHRGHNRQVVLASDEDYRHYPDNLHEWKEKPQAARFALIA